MVLPVNYKGETIDCGYRLDLLVEDTVIVELKALDALLPIHAVENISGKKKEQAGACSFGECILPV